MSNLSILERNMIHALDCEKTETAFLKAREHCCEFTAEAYALEYKRVSKAVATMLALAGSDTSANLADLHEFIMKRHWHFRFPKAKN